MATLQDIGTNVQAIHKSLEQGQSYLLACVASCKQYADQIRSGIDGTTSAEYSQIQALIQTSLDCINKTVLTISNADGILDRWSQERMGVSLGGIMETTPPNLTTMPDFEDASDGAAQPKLLTPDEVNERWKSVVNSTDQVLENYRDALTARGIQDNKLLDKFLQVQRAKMLKYEAAVLDEASGHGAVKDEDLYTYRIAGASGEYGFDSLANEYGAFCLDDTSKWIKDINPNFYDPFILPSRNPYHVNCGSCAFAVDTRLSGGDDLVATQKNIGTDHAMEMATGKRCVYMPLESIEDYLRNQGAGSHLIVGINRGPAPNGCPQSGHWFNVFFDGVNFHTIDGQSGEILEWPYDYGDITEWCALV